MRRELGSSLGRAGNLAPSPIRIKERLSSNVEVDVAVDAAHMCPSVYLPDNPPCSRGRPERPVEPKRVVTLEAQAIAVREIGP